MPAQFGGKMTTYTITLTQKNKSELMERIDSLKKDLKTPKAHIKNALMSYINNLEYRDLKNLIKINLEEK